ncbi:MAG: DNA-binding protein [Bacteroidota bacterium]
MTLTFNQLRKLKDSLPDGTMQKIAEDLKLHVETVRNYFGGAHFSKGDSVDLHIQPGPDGGIVKLEGDSAIMQRAKEILSEDGAWDRIMTSAGEAV